MIYEKEMLYIHKFRSFKKFFLSFEDMEGEITAKSFEKVAETAGVQ